MSRPRSSGAWSTKAWAPPSPPNAPREFAPNVTGSGPSTSKAALGMRWL
ncbi:hypothetical protein [Streptomyces sp. S4.7]|nr:hypothetical protein [Streptomyces sp. S4.7]